MKYEIREQADGTYRLYRYGKLAVPRDGRVGNAELEFWFEIEHLRSKLAAILLERDGHRGYRETVRHLREDVRHLRTENDGLRTLISDWGGEHTHPVLAESKGCPLCEALTRVSRALSLRQDISAALTPPAGTEGGAE